MAKRRKALFFAMIFSVVSLSAVAIANQFVMRPAGLSGAEHGPSCHYNHYDAVEPTEISHGSKEFWACCTHLTYVLTEPKEGEIIDRGPFAGDDFDALASTDERYIDPLSAQAHYIRIGDGEPIAMFDATSTLTPSDTCVLRFAVDGIDVQRGDVITFYRGEDELLGINEEIGSNIAVRSHIDNLSKKDFFVQTPCEDASIHLNIYSDGSMKTWASGYDDTYFQILVLKRGDNTHWIDFNLRLDQPFVEIYNDSYTSIVVPKGYMTMHLYEGDQIRFVRCQWWTNWGTPGDGWANTTSDGADPYMKVMTFEADYFLGCEDAAGFSGPYKGNKFLLASYAKDFFVNDVALPRESLRFDYDQVQVEVELKEGDCVYFKRYSASGEKTIGAGMAYGLADSYLFTSDGIALKCLRDGTYYFASWNVSLFLELRNTSWIKVINDLPKGGLALSPSNHRYILDTFELKMGDRLYFCNDAGDVVNASNVNETIHWSGSYEPNYTYDIFEADTGTGEFIAKRDCRVTVNFNFYSPKEKSFAAIMDRTWTLEVDGAAYAKTLTQERSTDFAFENIALTAGQKVRIYDDYSTRVFGYGDLALDLDDGFRHFKATGDGRMTVLDSGVYTFDVDCSAWAMQFKSVHVHEENDPSTADMPVTQTRLPDQFGIYWTDRVWIIELFHDDEHIRYVTCFDRVWQGNVGNSASYIYYHATSDTTLVRIYLCAKGTFVPNIDAESGPGYVYAYLTNPMIPSWGYEINLPSSWTVRSW